jgi:hypothetical protein
VQGSASLFRSFASSTTTSADLEVHAPVALSCMILTASPNLRCVTACTLLPTQVGETSINGADLKREDGSKTTEHMLLSLSCYRLIIRLN